MEIAGRTVLVTGGAHRVGKVIVRAAAKAGANVAFAFRRSMDLANQTIAELRQEFPGAKYGMYYCDVSSLGDVQALAEEVAEDFDGVDVLVNGASNFDKMSFPTANPSAWQEATQTTIDGSFYVANTFATNMVVRGGVIINITDTSAFKPWKDFMPHSVGKAALVALTQSMALELAPTVRVNAISPGLILAPDRSPKAWIDKMAQRNLLKRWGTPEDVAKAFLFLVENDFITGSVLSVDGGELLNGCS